MPKVSVVMASYNHEKFVRQAVKSVLDQTYKNFEFIITDDASSDRTPAEIRQFSDPRIRFYCFEKNQGQFAATNHCLRKVNGEYIAILNSDDVFLPDKLEKQVRFMDENFEIGAVFGQARIIDENGNDHNDKKNGLHTIFKQPNRTRFEWLNHFFYKRNCLCHTSVLIRKGCHDAIGFYNAMFAQFADLDLWVRLCMKYDIHIMPEEVVKFRIHSTNLSAKNMSTLKRSWYEYRHIFKHYLNIDSSEMLHSIFPETRKYGDGLDSDMIKFVVALQAVEFRPDSQIYQAFGLDTIFELLADEKAAKKIAQKFDFTFADFISLTGERDCLGIQRIRQQREFVKHNPIVKLFWKIQRKRL